MTFIRSTYRFVALIMAFLMFFSSAAIALDMHYCGGELKSISFLGKAKTCHDMAGENEAPVKACPHHKAAKAADKSCLENKDCCSNEIVILQSDQKQQVQASGIVVSQQLQQFVLSYITVFYTSYFSLKRDAASYVHYKPPLIPKDIPVLIESFLL